MTNEKPSCPQCSRNRDVSTLGGGSKNKYRYNCGNCNIVFQDIPPHRKHLFDMDSSEMSSMTDSRKVSKVNKDHNKQYKCGKCGALKKGHVCTVISNIPKSADKESTQNQNKYLYTSTYVPAGNALQESISLPLPFADFEGLRATI